MFGFGSFVSQNVLLRAMEKYIEVNEGLKAELMAQIEGLNKTLSEKDAEIASLKTGQLSFPFTFRT